MAKQKTPHTESGQNVPVSQTDLEPEALEQTAGRGEDAAVYEKNEGAQTGANRAEHTVRNRDGHGNTEAAPVAQEGELKDRTASGITGKKEESMRQEKVVKDRPDAQAGVNRG